MIMVTISGFKTQIEVEFNLAPEQVRVDADFRGNIYICVDANIRSCTVHDYLLMNAALGFKYIVVTDSGWER